MSRFQRHIVKTTSVPVELVDITPEFIIRQTFYDIGSNGRLGGYAHGGARSIRTRYYRNMKYVRYSAVPDVPVPLLVYYDDTENVISVDNDYTSLEDGSVQCRLRLPKGATNVAINGSYLTVPCILGVK